MSRNECQNFSMFCLSVSLVVQRFELDLGFQGFRSGVLPASYQRAVLSPRRILCVPALLATSRAPSREPLVQEHLPKKLPEIPSMSMLDLEYKAQPQTQMRVSGRIQDDEVLVLKGSFLSEFVAATFPGP